MATKPEVFRGTGLFVVSSWEDWDPLARPSFFDLRRFALPSLKQQIALFRGRAALPTTLGRSGAAVYPIGFQGLLWPFESLELSGKIGAAHQGRAIIRVVTIAPGLPDNGD